MTVRVAAVDDDTLIRVGIAQLLPDAIEVVGTFETVEQLLQDQPHVDVVLLDLRLSGTSMTAGLDGAAAIRAVAGAGFQVLIYTNERRRRVLVGCLAAGARGIVHKAEPISALAAAIASVAAGNIEVTQALIGLAELVDRRGDLPRLTPRQRQILSARARGEQFTSIAARLFISERTAQEHWYDIAEKFAEYLTAHSAADLERHLGLGPGDILA